MESDDDVAQHFRCAKFFVGKKRMPRCRKTVLKVVAARIEDPTVLTWVRIAYVCSYLFKKLRVLRCYTFYKFFMYGTKKCNLLKQWEMYCLIFGVVIVPVQPIFLNEHSAVFWIHLHLLALITRRNVVIKLKSHLGQIRFSFVDSCWCFLVLL